MVHAFIMMKTGAGRSEHVITELQELPGVTEAHVIAGDFDVIAEIDTSEVYEVLEMASDTIQRIEGVVDTRTYISLQ